MNRREFILGAAAASGLAGCATSTKSGDQGGRILFGACRGIKDAKVMKDVGYDFWEWGCGSAFDPKKDNEWWKRQRDEILAAPLPLRSCNGFIPGNFRLTGPAADHEPALKYGETVLRRAAEVGVKTIVFGSGGARNVPGDFTSAVKGAKPDLEKGAQQYTDFCRELCRRTADLGDKVTMVIEPLRPNESNIINFVWQGAQICEDVNSPRLNQLADIFHMMMGRESACSIKIAAKYMRHCHIADYETRQFPGFDPKYTDRLRPYFAALKAIGYEGGVSCECGWGVKGKGIKFEDALATALATMRSLV